jgi:hypothetical protein
VIGGISPSTASVHLNRLRAERLVGVVRQGKHRYYTLRGPNVARALEALSVVAGGARTKFVPTTPNGLRTARTCYDHIAGSVGTLLHDRFLKHGSLCFFPQQLLRPHALGRPGSSSFGTRHRCSSRSAEALRLRLPRLERAAVPFGGRSRSGNSRVRIAASTDDPGFQRSRARFHRSRPAVNGETLRHRRLKGLFYRGKVKPPLARSVSACRRTVTV